MIHRDHTTSKNDFVFYGNRMCRLVVEAGLGHLPFVDKTVITPAGVNGEGGGRTLKGGREGLIVDVGMGHPPFVGKTVIRYEGGSEGRGDRKYVRGGGHT